MRDCEERSAGQGGKEPPRASWRHRQSSKFWLKIACNSRDSIRILRCRDVGARPCERNRVDGISWLPRSPARDRSNPRASLSLCHGFVVGADVFVGAFDAVFGNVADALFGGEFVSGF